MFENMSAVKVKELIQSYDLDKQLEYVEKLKEDKRKAVQKLAEQIEKKHQKHQLEMKRLESMHQYEKEAYARGVALIAGLDEAGRGPLMGPVVAAAVILPETFMVPGLDDSKKIPETRREILYDIIMEKAISVGVGQASHEEIDEINILNATKLAMKRAIENLHLDPEFMLIDAVKLSDIDIEQLSLIKGDSRSVSIAAASIIAKVTRDRMVKVLAEQFPQYGFEKHKGYGTVYHYEAIRKYGISSVHRRSFLKNFE